ncbi:MAG: 4Fe-4S dicluster domain-containing protein [Desulfococcaceae bacterium]
MKWTPKAEAAVKKVPFFVRKRVRGRVEKEARAEGKPIVSLAEVKATQARYLNNMEKEIKGYRIEACFGSGGCPHRAVDSEELFLNLEALLQQEDLLGLLKSRVAGPLKFHHEFSVTLADCPNACSRPQIKDVGIIGAAVPAITDEPCTLCESCVAACKEKAISLDPAAEKPVLNRDACVDCGQCATECPSGTLATGRTGWRVLLGGKLGRHPRLARELPGIFEADEVLAIVKACIDFYRERSRHGERFAALLTEADFDNFAERFGKVDTS